MSAEFVIEQFSHDSPRLWTAIGRFFASRSIRKELGAAISSDPSYIWFVAFASDRGVAGWGAVEEKKRCVWLRHGYVLPEWRGRGVWNAVFDARIEYVTMRHPTLPVVARTTPAVTPAILRRGFVRERMFGRFAHVVLERVGPKQ